MTAIHQALQAKKWPTDESLEAELDVTARTIRRDIEFLRGQCHAPIGFDRVKKGYYYTEPTYRLAFPQLTQGELVLLFLAERMLRQFRGTPFEPGPRQAIAKISEMLPDGASVRLDSLADFLSVLPATESEYDPKWFCNLSAAVAGRRRLDLHYWAASRNEGLKPSAVRPRCANTSEAKANEQDWSLRLGPRSGS